MWMEESKKEKGRGGLEIGSGLIIKAGFMGCGKTFILNKAETTGAWNRGMK